MTSPTETREAVARTEEDLTPEEIAEIMAADPFHQPAPSPIPVRKRYFLTECEHCGWVGSSEQCGSHEDDISCAACHLSICGDEPNNADTAKHGEAVYQRIVTAEAEVSRLTAALEREGEALQEEIELHAEASAQLVTLRAERDAAINDRDESVLALEAKVAALAPHGSCACSYDRPGDVCAHHSPSLSAALSEVSRLTAALAESERQGAVMREALETIASASSEPDDKDWYPGVYGQPASYRVAGMTEGSPEIHPDEEQPGDMDSFGFERGVHSAAIIARAALTLKEPTHEH